MIREALSVALVVLAAWGLLWTWMDARRERRYLDAVRRHPSSLGVRECRCGMFALQYDAQQLLDQVDRVVHARHVCCPEIEWIEPGPCGICGPLCQAPNR